MNTFQENIKKWVHLDTQLKLLNDKTKEIRSEKSKLSDNIFEFVDSNNLNTSTIKISDGKLKFAQTKQTAPITLGFLESCLNETIRNDKTVAHIMEYIKSKRETKIIYDIKRYYDN